MIGDKSLKSPNHAQIFQNACDYKSQTTLLIKIIYQSGGEEHNNKNDNISNNEEGEGTLSYPSICYISSKLHQQ